MKVTVTALASTLLLGSSLSAQTPDHRAAQAHDHHAAQTLGTVRFETSCAPSVRQRFDTAVALMHSFQFGRAIETFNAILAADPSCAMAHWGIALSRWSNPFAGFKSPAQLAQGLDAVGKARAIGTGTAREKAYVDAVAQLYVDSARRSQSERLKAYEQAMAAVSNAYPEDVEATIFYALALAAAADPSDQTYARQRRAGALLEPLFARYPDHPGLAHYIIHAYDEPALAARAAGAAKRYGAIAPSTPHALHMPSHTFTRVGDWQASIDTNKASADAARAAGQPADVLHASDYMIYGYLQTGQDEAARRLVATSVEVFRTFDPARASGAAPASAAFFANAAIPARFALERHAWSEAAALAPHPSPFPNADAITFFARGFGAASRKDGATARAAIAALEQLRGKLADTNDDYWTGQIDIAMREVSGRLALAEGDVEKGLADLRDAAAREDKTELASVTPGPFLPAREILGDMLLSLGRPTEALAEYRASLERDPNRFWSLYGAASAARRAGDSAAARDHARRLLELTRRADPSRRAALDEMRRLTG
ncbi:lipopolysaccharide assembly protein LapB [Sphingosinicella sp. BN140058]|uniref:tetratricopeptide repeat protein n=1 Tax=Sphingosinicella sp. BN140058 TaxID=1892855 RepID=UPI0010128DB8|nr:tetratricopeptide repeat protein [Sphingosinicella sp. BN140058]QAY76320.1 hypothetical protein ETR14_07085 [Sphingosinicella sp. BN140058]